MLEAEGGEIFVFLMKEDVNFLKGYQTPKFSAELHPPFRYSCVCVRGIRLPFGYTRVAVGGIPLPLSHTRRLVAGICLKKVEMDSRLQMSGMTRKRDGVPIKEKLRQLSTLHTPLFFL